MENLKTILSTMHGGKILDVATSSGGFLQLLMTSFNNFDEAIGIDIDPIRYKEAQDKITDSRVKFLKMDGENILFEDASFDTVSISKALHHLSNTNNVLSEMYRVLKPNGLFIVNEMYSDNQTDPQLTHVLLHSWWASIDTKLGIPHYETYKKANIIDLVRQTGVEILHCFEYSDFTKDCKDPVELENQNIDIDNTIKQARQIPDCDKFIETGEQLRKRLFDVGFTRATQVVIIGKKRV